MKYVTICVLILAGISPVSGGTPTVSNLTGQGVTISWTTAVPEKGWVEYGTTTSLDMITNDDRGSEIVDDTHYVTIENLSGTTTYYYRIASDAGKGTPSTFTTYDPMISFPPSQDSAYGEVYFQGTTINAKGAIIYAIIKDANGTGTTGTSAVLSNLSNNSGWSISFANFRTWDGQQPFQYSQGDELILWADAAGDGIASTTVTIGTSTNTIQTNLLLTDDTVAPPDTPILQPIPGNGCISLSWKMPDISSGVSGILILRSQQDYPQATLTAGASYTIGSSTLDNSTVIHVATDTTWIDNTVTNGTTYYYRIFTYDGAYNYSPGVVFHATPVVNLDYAVVYPNPLVGNGKVYFNKLLTNTHICIYNVAGELVFEAESPDGTYLWSPKDLASGIYLYLLRNDTGEIQTGKIGIVK